MNIKIGDYNLLESITIIQMNNLPISCELEDSIEGNIYFEIKFEEDKNVSHSYTHLKSENNSHLSITIFNQTDIGGNIDLMEIGTYMNIFKLYMNIRITNVHDDTRTIILNLYTKKKED